MSIASAIQNLTNTIRGIASTKQDIKSAVNTDIDFINNEQIEQYPNLIRNAINQYKSYIPVVTREEKLLSLNTVPLKMKEFAVKGDTFQATRILPEGYTQLDYIESTGTQYIDTGINADSNLRVVLDMAYTEPSGANQNIGAINLPSGDNIRYHILSQNGYMRIYLQKGNLAISTIEADTNRHYYDIDAPNKTVLVDNNTYTVAISNFDTELNFWLFGRNSTSTMYYCKCKTWRCKMYYNGTLVRDFIPCKNPNNEVGLYDLVSKTFFGNQGTGAFTAGAEAVIPNSDFKQNIQVVTGSQKVIKCRKNLCKSFSNGTSKSRYYASLYIEADFQVGKKYVVSFEDDSTGNVYYRNEYFMSANSYSITTTGERQSYYFTCVSNDKTNTSIYTNNKGFIILKNNQAQTEVPQFKNVQVEEVEDYNVPATDYEAYSGIELPLNLGNLELCKIEDYQDYFYKENSNWYKYKAINKNSFNGTENWTRYYNSTRGGGFYITISDGIGGSPCLCNKFTNDNAHTVWFGKVGTFRIADTLNAGFKTTPAETEPVTKEQWQSELSTSNLILYYPLATPVIEQITDPILISQLEAINNLNMNNGTTIIYAVNEEGLQPTLYVEAYKKIEEEN